MRLPRTETGCRPDALDGAWAIETSRYDEMAARVYAEIDSRGLPALAAASQKQNEESPPSVLTLDQSGIARVSLSGPMTKYPTSVQAITGGTAMLPLTHAIRQATVDANVKGMFVDIDSPGGTVMGTPELYDAMRSFAAAKPLEAHISGAGTSGAYWLAMAADKITADPAAVVGSVGAVLRLSDRSEYLRQRGVKVHYVTSPGADRKAIGAEGSPITEADKAEVSKFAAEAVAPFHAALDQRRNLSPENKADVLRAGVYGAQSALNIGLIDGISFAAHAYESFVNSVSDGSYGRAKRTNTNPAENIRSIPMPISATQAESLRKLPGAPSDDAALVSFAADQAITATKAAASADGIIASLRSELATARAAAPKTIDPDLLADRAAVASERIDAQVERARISAPQAKALKAAVAAAPHVWLADAGGRSPFEAALSLFRDNDGPAKSNAALIQNTTEAQPTARTVPGTEANAEQEKSTADAVAAAEKYRDEEIRRRAPR